MIHRTQFALMLLPLMGFRAVQGFRPTALDVQHYHPGHTPHHVTRLHRYEHMGMQSMLEEEEQWTQEMQSMQRSSASGRVLKEVHHVRGSSLLEESQENQDSRSADGDHSGFVKLSDIQAKALEQHHQAWNDFTATYRQHHGGDEAVVATALSSLSSQYVGPIGVGSVVEPSNCVMQQTATNASMLSKLGGLFTKGPSSSFAQSCRIADQSKVWVVFDTGSTNIWIASDLCKSGPCQLPGRHMFNHTASASFAFPRSMLQLSVQFATGKITGPQGIDDFHIGPFTVHNQSFGMIETETGSSVFSDVPFEGIVGMAFDRMSANNVKPFFSSMIEQKALNHNEFAFYFSKSKPSANALFWGGVDKNFYEGELQYFPVIDPYYWSLKLLNFKIGDDVMLDSSNTYNGSNNPHRRWNGPVAVVDTGTTFFTAEGDKFDEVMRKLPPGLCKYVTEKTHPPITISLENTRGTATDFVLTNKQYMSRSVSDGQGYCSPAFMKVNLPIDHGPGMVLGEVFLRSFFGVFDRDTGNDLDAKVAFAKSSDKPEALSRLHELTADQPSFRQSTLAANPLHSAVDDVN